MTWAVLNSFWFHVGGLLAVAGVLGVWHWVDDRKRKKLEEIEAQKILKIQIMKTPTSRNSCT